MAGRCTQVEQEPTCSWLALCFHRRNLDVWLKQVRNSVGCLERELERETHFSKAAISHNRRFKGGCGVGVVVFSHSQQIACEHRTQLLLKGWSPLFFLCFSCVFNFVPGQRFQNSNTSRVCLRLLLRFPPLTLPSRVPRNLRRNDLVNIPVGFFDGLDALAKL